MYFVNHFYRPWLPDSEYISQRLCQIWTRSQQKGPPWHSKKVLLTLISQTITRCSKSETNNACRAS